VRGPFSEYLAVHTEDLADGLNIYESRAGHPQNPPRHGTLTNRAAVRVRMMSYEVGSNDASVAVRGLSGANLSCTDGLADNLWWLD
jgi:hypothetical protein